MTKKLTLIIIAVLVLAIVPQFTTLGQDEDRPSRGRIPQYEKEIAVNYMLVDVVVTDSKGNYIRNLTKDDFELYEDGKKVEIRSLDEYQMGTQMEDESVTEMASGDLILQQPPRNIIFYLDMFNSSSFGIKRALDVLEDFVIDRIQPGDRVMVLGYYQSLKIIQNFTDDKNEVINSLRNTGLFSESRIARIDAPYGSTATNMPSGSSEFLIDEELGQSILEVQNDRMYYQRMARNYISSMKALGNILKQIKGRKTLVLLSEGIDFNMIDPTQINDSETGLLARQQMNQSDTDAMAPPPQRMLSLVPEYLRMVEQLNDSQISIYSVNVGGLQPLGDATEQFGERDSSPAGGASMRPGAQQLEGRQDFLSAVSFETGGRAYFNTNDMRTLLDKIEVDISNYYILGFRSEFNPNKSEYRDIRVRVKQPGLKVLHRKGFRTPVPFEKMDKDQRDMHLVTGLESGLELNELNAFAESRMALVGDDDVRTTVAVDIPVDKLNTDKRNRFDLQVLVSNINEEGKVFSSVHKQLLVESADSEELAAKGVRLVESIDSQFGVNKIRVALRDNTTGKRTYFYFNTIYREPPEDGLVVATPVFYDTADMKRLEDEFKVTSKPQDKWNSETPGGGSALVHPELGKVFPLIIARYTSGQEMHFFTTIQNFDREEVGEEDLDIVFAISPKPKNKQEKRTFYKLDVSEMKVFRQRAGSGLDLVVSGAMPAVEQGVYDIYIAITDKVGQRNGAGSSTVYVVE